MKRLITVAWPLVYGQIFGDDVEEALNGLPPVSAEVRQISSKDVVVDLREPGLYNFFQRVALGKVAEEERARAEEERRKNEGEGDGVSEISGTGDELDFATETQKEKRKSKASNTD